jgi:hypothetical protein
MILSLEKPIPTLLWIFKKRENTPPVLFGLYPKALPLEKKEKEFWPNTPLLTETV